MRFASALAIGLCALSLSSARADDEQAPPDPRAQLSAQLAAETQTIEQTLATVGDKLSAADAQRLRRIRAAYRILRAPLTTTASATDRMASARRRAAARLLLERDGSERTLLASEAAQLTEARTTKIEATTKIPTLVLPEELGRPCKGDIARRFGTYQHDKSHATLSRRGLDFETSHNAPASAPADGVVRYAGPIRGLDYGVILDHGDYLTIVAKLAELSIPVGTHVTRGDRLGHAARYRVYLEVRAKVAAGGIPIDPEPLLRAGASARD
ncbi:MAG TPA: M23 family metallopeptidase [Kofleriaceae bacterium]